MAAARTRRHLRRAGLAAWLFAAFAIPAAYAADPAVAAAKLNAGLAALEKNSAAPFADRYAQLAPVIEHSFDLSQFLRTSVGARWASLSPSDQATLEKLFHAYTVASYVANFSDAHGPSFKLDPATRAVGSDMIVSTGLVPSDGSDATVIAYLMRDTGAGFRIVDVLVNGTISQAAVQRSDFRSQLAGEKDAQKLIAMLTEKVKTLSGGTVSP